MSGFKVFLEATATNPFLSKFYKEPKRYALRMQIWLLKHRYNTYYQALKEMESSGKGVILDRSIFSDFVFAKKNLVDGNISKEGFDKYFELRRKMLSTVPRPDLMIFLDVNSRECHRRIHEIRKREAEVSSGIPIEYLQGLEECYKELLIEMESSGTRIGRLDWNNFGQVDQFFEKIRHFHPDKKLEWISNDGEFKRLIEYSVNPEWTADYHDLNIQVDHELDKEREAHKRELLSQK